MALCLARPKNAPLNATFKAAAVVVLTVPANRSPIVSRPIPAIPGRANHYPSRSTRPANRAASFQASNWVRPLAEMTSRPRVAVTSHTVRASASWKPTSPTDQPRTCR